jgi:hypothetical protein
VPIQGVTSSAESDLSPFTAEYQLKRACSTQNKAKWANKIVFLTLVRDQEAEGSNPLAPTTYLFSIVPSDAIAPRFPARTYSATNPRFAPQTIGDPPLPRSEPAAPG